MTETGFSKCECRHCAGHIEFPKDAAGQTVPCPHCGKLTELGANPGKRSFLPLIIAVVLFIVISGVSVWFVLQKKNEPSAGLQTNPSAVTNVSVAKKPSDGIITNQFSVSGVKLTKTTNSSLIYVTGKVRNLSDQKRYGVKVEFSLLTANAAPAGNASDYASSIDPDSDWNFKALVLDSKAATARLSSIAETK
jgi:hypothetical protein